LLFGVATKGDDDDDDDIVVMVVVSLDWVCQECSLNDFKS